MKQSAACVVCAVGNSCSIFPMITSLRHCFLVSLLLSDHGCCCRQPLAVDPMTLPAVGEAPVRPACDAAPPAAFDAGCVRNICVLAIIGRMAALASIIDFGSSP